VCLATNIKEDWMCSVLAMDVWSGYGDVLF